MGVERVIILTGISGSGKTTALRAFEDRGFFCVDNMPLPLIPNLVEELAPLLPGLPGIVLGIDIRERQFFPLLSPVMDKLKDTSGRLDVIFLESSPEMLVRRFSESRRPHPLMERLKDIHKALAEERDALRDMRDRAVLVVDTSNYTVHQLKNRMCSFIDQLGSHGSLSVQVLSFGFKHGVPLEADLVFDLRFLPNPHFVADLKNKTGQHDQVYDYVFGNDMADGFYQRLRDLVDYSLPGYQAEGKAYLTIALGCTGGRHRSVAFARRLFHDLDGRQGLSVLIRHRDMDLA